VIHHKRFTIFEIKNEEVHHYSVGSLEQQQQQQISIHQRLRFLIIVIGGPYDKQHFDGTTG